MRRVLLGFFRAIHQLLHSPQTVLWICIGLVVLNLVLDGSLLRWWSLSRDQKAIDANIAVLKTKNTELQARLQRARDPSFLEREARDRFDLVSEGDLVFVFSEEEAP